MLQKNKKYKMENGKLFPFKEQVGIYIGELPSGFLEFKLSGNKVCGMNGGCYELVEENEADKCMGQVLKISCSLNNEESFALELYINEHYMVRTDLEEIKQEIKRHPCACSGINDVLNIINKYRRVQ
ncbi:hypothetical protein LCGC14_2131210 [marine sediment metagenome]|uniref:Uncharacterized protein n=1 Tax=marine sediment metagenome TaxID=412755 RepID=A0A0F9GEH2_9ZZZZ